MPDRPRPPLLPDPPKLNDPYAIVLPCAPDDFKDFVSGLLGKPQTIEKVIRGTFVVKREEILAFYHLVEQRLHQQNDSHLVQFTVRVIYDDGSSILLNSLSDFERYNEVRAVASTGVHLGWTYLVKFNDKTVPEKQRIDVSIVATHRFKGLSFVDDGEEPLFLHHGRRGLIRFRIEHTARTWGSDIESLLTNHVNNLLLRESKPRRFIEQKSGWIGLCLGLLLFLSALCTGVLVAARFARVQEATARDFFKAAAANGRYDVSKGIETVVDTLASGLWPQFMLKIVLFFFLAATISIGLGLWAGIAADNVPPSFVILSKEAEKRQLELERSFRQKFWNFCGAVIVSIGTGVVGDLVFTNFWGH